MTTYNLGTDSQTPARVQYRSGITMLARALVRAPQPRSPRATALPYINLAMLEAELQVLIDRFVGDLAEQGEVRDTDLLLFGGLKGGLFDLALAGLAAVTDVGDCFIAPEATLLLPALGAS